ALKAAGVRYLAHQYPGTQHGFHNDTTPRYDANAAQLAWERTFGFFRQHLQAG
ncbi:MAG: dienelactone hydrolase family protein, partial [Hydrogenophaga sp.]|nr:dienelactone hydrolase family protein [Hydrogenophaga sp.]